MTSVKRRFGALLAILLLTSAGLAAPAAAATNLTVMSFNIWMRGSHGGIGSVVNQIRASGANVVALSETGGGATEAIADALGWQHTEPGWDIDVISALPIQETDWKSWNDTGAQAIAAKIAGVWSTRSTSTTPNTVRTTLASTRTVSTRSSPTRRTGVVRPSRSRRGPAVARASSPVT